MGGLGVRSVQPNREVLDVLLGGGNSRIFYFHSENWGRWIHCDEHIFQTG